MRFWLLTLLTFNFALFISACGLDIEDPTPPSPPVWVQKSLPEEWPERGIDAHESGGIFLEWEDNPNEDIVAYNVYRATWYDMNDSLGNYDLLTVIKLDSNPSLEYIDQSTNQLTRYYYKLKSLDVAGNVSNYSESVWYLLLPVLEIATMSPNGVFSNLGDQRELRWPYTSTIELEDYCLTVINSTDTLVLRSSFAPTNYIDGGSEIFQIPQDIILETGHVYRWRIEFGAMYVNSYETAGSESQWATFLYSGTDA
jgi:hypothetical protein